MNKKQIKILVITFIVVALIVFLVFLLTNNGSEIVNKDKSSPASEQEKLEPSKSEEKKVIEPTPVEVKENSVELEIKSIARNFAERYGTWSTDNKVDNFKSAKVYATSRMENIIEDFILNNEILSADYDGYYGVTAKALNVKLTDSNETSANLVVSVQQLETSGENLEEKTSYQSLYLELVRSGDSWLVDYAEWE